MLPLPGSWAGHIRDKFLGLAQYLNERSRRVWAALEARALGFGGVALVARATGIHRDTITAGLQPTFGTIYCQTQSWCGFRGLVIRM